MDNENCHGAFLALLDWLCQVVASVAAGLKVKRNIVESICKNVQVFFFFFNLSFDLLTRLWMI